MSGTSERGTEGEAGIPRVGADGEWAGVEAGEEADGGAEEPKEAEEQGQQTGAADVDAPTTQQASTAKSGRAENEPQAETTRGTSLPTERQRRYHKDTMDKRAWSERKGKADKRAHAERATRNSVYGGGMEEENK
jgi:hypothetical protein